MTFDPSSPNTRGKVTGWFSSLMGGRSSGGRMTRVSDLPPRVLDDIGINRDFVDVMLRHRR